MDNLVVVPLFAVTEKVLAPGRRGYRSKEVLVEELLVESSSACTLARPIPEPASAWPSGARPGRRAAQPQRRRDPRMTVPLQPIEVLLVEDDPGDELMTREAFEDNKISNRLHVVTKPVDVYQFIAAVRQIDDFFVSVVRLPRQLPHDQML
jgi:hypothetical protein